MKEADLQETYWDYIIVGTGIGGATLGYGLAGLNKKILYLEKGLSESNQNLPLIKGQFPEDQLSSFEKLTTQDLEILKRAGRFTQTVTDTSHSHNPQTFVPLLGEGAGGSSQLYGAAMERFFPEDFQATKFFGNLKDSSTVDWPLGYSDYTKYYEKAELIYQVMGSTDPLRKAFQNSQFNHTKLTVSGQKVFDIWSKNGLHPYRLPVGHVPHDSSTCKGCQAFICAAAEKSDAAQMCLYPSLKYENVHLLDNCEVQFLKASATKVTEVIAKRQNQTLSFKGDKIILAAGALNTPKLLLQSKSDLWPNGLANHSKQVGKNLSRHFMDLYMLKIHPKDGGIDYHEKELALNDFYIVNGEKYGTVQSLGNPPAVSTALFEMHSEYATSSKLWKKMYYQMVSRFAKPVMRHLFQNSLCIAAIMDDVSYEDNHVYLSSDAKSLQFQYKIRPEGHKRLSEFRKLISQSFNPHKPDLHKQGENNQRLAHASGTCRMGNRRESSVVDQFNRAHDIENLYIVDSSFFPSGSGTNPALTIAANALRVAEHLSK